jgi:predicted nucleic acid-binding protein
MMKTLVLDANILIRAVLGQRVRQLLIDHAQQVNFFAADLAFDEARHHLPVILEKRGLLAAPGLIALDAVAAVVCPLDAGLYGHLQRPALARIAERDPDDWPTLACALLLGCPIWSEDADFFGTGVATWTTSRIGVFFDLS